MTFIKYIFLHKKIVLINVPRRKFCTLFFQISNYNFYTILSKCSCNFVIVFYKTKKLFLNEK